MKAFLLLLTVLLAMEFAEAQGTVIVGNTGVTLAMYGNFSPIPKATGRVQVVFHGAIISTNGAAGVPFKANGGFALPAPLIVPGTYPGDIVPLTVQFWDSAYGGTYDICCVRGSRDIVSPPLGGPTNPPKTILQGSEPWKATMTDLCPCCGWYPQLTYVQTKTNLQINWFQAFAGSGDYRIQFTTNLHDGPWIDLDWSQIHIKYYPMGGYYGSVTLSLTNSTTCFRLYSP